MSIHLYDYVYNYDDFAKNMGLHDPWFDFSFFKSEEELKQMEIERQNVH